MASTTIKTVYHPIPAAGTGGGFLPLDCQNSTLTSTGFADIVPSDALNNSSIIYSIWWECWSDVGGSVLFSQELLVHTPNGAEKTGYTPAIDFIIDTTPINTLTDYYRVDSLIVTSTNISAGDLMRGYIYRKGNSVADTHDASIYLHAYSIKYNAYIYTPPEIGGD